jgi:RNA polymerase sigma-70 factor (ECF subfamily)
MDETRFLELIQTFQPMLYKISRIYRKSREDQEDLLQEIIYQLWKSHRSFNGSAQVGTWIYRVALNTALADFRKKRPPVQYPDQLPEVGTSQEEEDNRETRLINALQQLPDGDKTIIMLYMESLSYKEIAAITGVSENNVGVKLNRIKSKLQNILSNGTE